MSDDTIKRSDAIKAVWKPQVKPNELIFDALKTAIESEINNVPSADRPQGEWRKHDKERDYCSVCKHIFKTRTLTKQDKWTTYVDDLGYNFCPNCGARMKGADDD